MKTKFLGVALPNYHYIDRKEKKSSNKKNKSMEKNRS